MLFKLLPPAVLRWLKEFLTTDWQNIVQIFSAVYAIYLNIYVFLEDQSFEKEIHYQHPSSGESGKI